MSKKAAKIRDRIKSLRRVRAGDLKPSPRNWREHPEAQRAALQAILSEVGYAGALAARELADGSLELVDGHLRADMDPEEKVPVLILDINEADAIKLLATLDPLAAMAGTNKDALGALLGEIDTESEELAKMLKGLADEHGIKSEDEAGKAETAQPIIARSATLAELAPSDEEKAVLAGRRVIVEFSGGKDSSAAAIWCKHFLPDAPIELLFIEMGADFVGFNLFLREFADWLGGDLQVRRSDVNMIDRFLAKGVWPHFMFPYCQELLHGELDKRISAFEDHEIVVVRGGRRQESGAQQVKRRSRKRERVEDCNCSSCPVAEERDAESRWMMVKRLPGYRYFQPLYFSDKASSEVVIAEAKAPVWEGYGRGLCRTACRVCPGQRPRAYTAIRREYPEVWKELLALEALLGPGCWNRGPNKKKVPGFTALADHGLEQLDKEAARSAKPGSR